MIHSRATFWCPPPTGHKMAPKKPRFSKFLSAKPRIVSPTSRRTISVKFEHKTCVGEVMKTFGTKIRKFFTKGSLTPINLILVVFREYTYGTRAAAVAFRPTANLSIVPYSRRARNACTPSDFFVSLTGYEISYRGENLTLISGTSQHVATFPLPLQHRLVRYRLHIWQLDRSNGGVTITVTWDDDQDLYFSFNDIHLNENFRNQVLGAFLFRDTSVPRSPAVAFIGLQPI